MKSQQKKVNETKYLGGEKKTRTKNKRENGQPHTKISTKCRYAGNKTAFSMSIKYQLKFHLTAIIDLNLI